MRGLDGKVVLLAGAATGIGAATAERLVAEGATVVIGDLNLPGAQETAARLRAAGGRATAHPCDIADEDQVRALVAATVAEHGGIDGLFNNAADISAPHMAQDTDVVRIPNEVWQHTLDVNLTGFLFLSRHVIPHLVERGGGSIVQTSSEAAFGGEPVRVAYAVSKAGINVLTRHIASRWGKQGIRRNSIAPGMVLTEGAKANMPQQALDEVLAWTRLPRLGSPDDIAGMATYLLSDDGAWVSGQVLRVNGGVALT